MFCKECGEKIAKNSKFCRFCGTKIEDEEEIDEIEENTEEVVEEKEEKQEQEENKNIELTDNIDVTKIVVESDIKENKKEETKTQDFEEVLKDINKSIDSMSGEIPSPGETKKAKDINLDPSKEIKNILEEFNNDEAKEKEAEIEPSIEEKEEPEQKEEKVEEEKNDTPEVDMDETTYVQIEDNDTEEQEDLEKTSIAIEEELNSDISEVEPIKVINITEDDIEEPQEKKSSSKVLPIILSILLVVSIACIVCTYMMYAKEKENIEKLEKENTKLEEKLKKAEDKDTGEEKVTKYYLEGFEISLPSTDEITFINNSLLVHSIDSNIYTYIKKNLKYEDIKGTMWKNKSVIENDEYKVEKYGTKVVDSREYVVYEIVNTKGEKYAVAYSDINGKDIIVFVINNKDNNTNCEELAITNTIVDSLKENSSIVNHNINIFSE